MGRVETTREAEHFGTDMEVEEGPFARLHCRACLQQGVLKGSNSTNHSILHKMSVKILYSPDVVTQSPIPSQLADFTLQYALNAMPSPPFFETQLFGVWCKASVDRWHTIPRGPRHKEAEWKSTPWSSHPTSCAPCFRLLQTNMFNGKPKLKLPSEAFALFRFTPVAGFMASRAAV